MSKTTYDKPEDETELTRHIASALDEYIEGGFARTCMMGIKRQGLAALSSIEVLPDLVKRLDERRILALEVKVRHSTQKDSVRTHRFKSFEAKQRKIYEALYLCRVPIFYCYNAGDGLHELLSGKAILQSNKASEPRLACNDDGVVTLYDQHVTLLEIIEELKSGKIGRTGGGCGAVFPFIAGANTSRLGIRRLLLAYNLTEKTFEIYDDDYLRNIVDRAMGAKISPYENLGERTPKEIIAAFKSYTKEFNLALQNPKKTKNASRSSGFSI